MLSPWGALYWRYKANSHKTQTVRWAGFPSILWKLPNFTFRHRTLSSGKPAICMQSHLCFCLQNLWFEAHWNSFLKDKHKILNWHLNWKIFTFEWYPCFKIESYGISKISGTEICSNKKYEENNSAVTSIFKRNPCLTNWYLWQLLQAGLSFCNWNTTRAYCFHICLNIIFNEDSSFCSKSPQILVIFRPFWPLFTILTQGVWTLVHVGP